jgi:hypothetical protein
MALCLPNGKRERHFCSPETAVQLLHNLVPWTNMPQGFKNKLYVPLLTQQHARCHQLNSMSMQAAHRLHLTVQLDLASITHATPAALHAMALRLPNGTHWDATSVSWACCAAFAQAWCHTSVMPHANMSQIIGFILPPALPLAKTSYCRNPSIGTKKMP